jgi:hypothetical protein
MCNRKYEPKVRRGNKQEYDPKFGHHRVAASLSLSLHESKERDGSRNLTLGVQIPINTNHQGEKLKMVHAFTPIKAQIGYCSNDVSKG